MNSSKKIRDSFDYKDKFHDLTSKNLSNRTQMNNIILIGCANAIVLLSYTFHVYWWERCSTIVLIVMSFLYLVFIMANSEGRRESGTLFTTGIIRFKEWCNYCENTVFSNCPPYSSSGYIAPIKNGDYLWLSNQENGFYVSFIVHSHYIGKDIDMNECYSARIELIDIINNEIVYSQSDHQCFEWIELIEPLYKQIKKDNFDVMSVQNEFGDFKWKKSSIKKAPKKTRKYIFSVGLILWYIISIVITIAPIIGLFYRRFLALSEY